MAKSNAPFNPSPADAYYDELRAQGACVTSPQFQGLKDPNPFPVPVSVHPQDQPTASSKVPPKDDSMHDG